MATANQRKTTKVPTTTNRNPTKPMAEAATDMGTAIAAADTAANLHTVQKSSQNHMVGIIFKKN
jgi:hypothetical protein